MPRAREKKNQIHTYGMGIMAIAISAMSVFAHLYVMTSNIRVVKRGKMVPNMFPGKPHWSDSVLDIRIRTYGTGSDLPGPRMHRARSWFSIRQ
jgi:hypothetical protein